VASKFIDSWLDGARPLDQHANLWVYREREDARSIVVPAVCEAVKDHLVGLDVLQRIGGYPECAAVIKNSLPTRKKIRSGDLGEILATEYVDQKTDYRVPIRRLRYKDDRDTAMRGDDVLAVRPSGNVTQVLKVEAKSRAALGTTTVSEASAALMKNAARPNPSTLAFVSKRLREVGRDDDAAIIEQLQRRAVREQDIEHLLFTFSGNNPTTILSQHTASPKPTVARRLVGIYLKDHQEFIKTVFESTK
jgi:hypothetical protein